MDDEWNKEVFRQEEHFEGVLSRNGIAIAEVTVDLDFNPFETSQMTAMLTDFHPLEGGISWAPSDEAEYAIESSNVPDTILVSLTRRGKHDPLRHLFPPTEFREGIESMTVSRAQSAAVHDNEQTISQIVWSYSLSPIQAIDNGWCPEHMRSRVYPKNKDTGDLMLPRRDVAQFDVGNAIVRTYYSLQYSKSVGDNRETHSGVCLTHPQLNVVFETAPIRGTDLSGVEQLAGAIQNILSLVRHDWIRPFKIRKIVIDSNDVLRETETVHLWMPDTTPSPLRLTGWRIRDDKFEETLSTLSRHWLVLSERDKERFNEVCDRFKVVFYASTIEDRFTKLHSVLDFICKKMNRIDRPFSRKLIFACDDAKVDFEDLFPSPTREEMTRGESPRAFRFTTIRNQFIHEGFEVDNYDEMISLTYKMCTLAERLVLHFLNVDYRNMPISPT